MPNQGYTPSTQVVNLSVFDSPGMLSKKFSRGADDRITKTPAAELTGGTCARVSVPFAELPSVMDGLSANQAVSWGIMKVNAAQIRTQKHAKPPDTWARTRENFDWAEGPGVMMLDFDACRLTPNAAWAALVNICPELAGAAWFLRPSLSACVHLPDQAPSAPKSWHVYVLVADAGDIPRAGKLLFDRIWLAGFGHIIISKAGTLLTRSLIDSAVWQPERLDFVGEPLVGDGLTYTKPVVDYHEGTALDTATALPALTPLEQAHLAQLQAEAKAKERPKAAEAFKIYAEAQAAQAQPADPVLFVKQLRTILTAQPKLPSEFLLHRRGGEVVSVGEVAANPKAWAGARFCDPLEPTYGGDDRVAVVQVNRHGQPTIYSHAHGGVRYQLIPDCRLTYPAPEQNAAPAPAKECGIGDDHESHDDAPSAETKPQRPQVVIRPGRAGKAVTAIYAALCTCPDLYNMGGRLARVTDRTTLLNEHQLTRLVADHIDVVKVDDCGGLYLVDLPPRCALMVLSDARDAGLRPLDGVATAPYVRPDGVLVSTPGYDPVTRLVLVLPVCAPDPFADPQEALAFLMEPFGEFPWATEQDRAGFVAALLTAVQRRVLPSAPAMGLDAPVQGSGKTLLARCLAVLSTGESASVSAYVKDEAEIRKSLLAGLLDGSGALVVDNVLGSFDSAALAAFLTAPTFSDRILGRSERIALPNRTLTLLTGNNLTPAGDLARRVLNIRIDPRMADPQGRNFDIDPEAYVSAHRQAMAMAACTIIKAYLDSGATPRPGRTASYEDWDTLVRQPVAWITGYDPLDRLKDTSANDPDREILSDLLHGLRSTFGLGEFDARDVLAHSDKIAVLHDLFPNRITARGVGMLLRYRCDRVSAGLALRHRRDAHQNRGVFRVEVLRELDAEPGLGGTRFSASSATENTSNNKDLSSVLRNCGTKSAIPPTISRADSTQATPGVTPTLTEYSEGETSRVKDRKADLVPQNNPYYRAKSGG